jgi:hypothetical protein
MREKILGLIQRKGPISVPSLERLTGLSDKPIRSAIDALRLRNEPIWLSVNGFWYGPMHKVAPAGSGRWKREPSLADARYSARAEHSGLPTVAPRALTTKEATASAKAAHGGFKTPEIPRSIREMKAVPYVNIFELNLGNKNLYGTETLLGDWDGPLLVVAKDFAPADEVRGVAARTGNRQLAYRHNDGDGRYNTGWRTNTRLVKFIYGESGRQLIDGSANTTCGALYISACFFLKPGASTSSSLDGWAPGRAVFDQSVEVLRFVVHHMPNLRGIACLGGDAEKLVSVAYPTPSGKTKVQRLAHPRVGSDQEQNEEWAAFMQRSGIQVSGLTLKAI